MTPRPVPGRVLSPRPDLDQLRRQAKELLDAFRAGEPDAMAEVHAHYRDADRAALALHDAHLVLARSYGFESWPKLKAYVDGVTARLLAEAVRAGDFARVRVMLRARPELVDMDIADHDEHRALHHAVLARSPKMARLLMREGADARSGIYPHRDATSALTIATDRGYGEIVAIICEEERARPAAQHRPHAPRLDSADGPLADAVKRNRPDVLASLLAQGIHPDERTRLESVDDVVFSAGMPLHHCATTGKLEMARMLLEAGADPNVHVHAAGSSIHRAYTSGNAQMIELLEQYGGVVDGITVGALGLTDRARRMLDDEAAGRLPGKAIAAVLGRRAIAEDLLWGASGAGHADIVRLCLDRIDWPREDSSWYVMLREPMYIGLERSKAERETLIACFRLMLDRADPNVQGNRERGWVGGRTLLHDLSGTRHQMPPEDRVAIATMLLDAGARLDIRDDLLESTPLGWACRWGRLELVHLLLERDADPVEADAKPWASPLAWARAKGHTEAETTLLKAVARQA